MSNGKSLNTLGLSRREFLRLSTLLGTAAAAGALVGCQPSAPASQATPTPAALPSPTRTGPFGQVVAVQGFEVNTTDPHLINSAPGRRLLRHTFERLIDMDGKGQIGPLLAESWENPDPMTWIFHLRKGVEFSNGEKFDSAAAKFSIDRFRSPDIKNQYVGDLKSVDRVEVIDDFSIKLTTKTAFSSLLTAGLLDVAMVPPKAVQSSGDSFGKRGIGSGLFKITEWVPGEKLVMEANEAYWGGASKIKTIVWRPVAEASTRLVELRSGAADVIYPLPVDDIPSLEGTGASVVKGTGSMRMYIFLNCSKPPFDNKLVRQALNYAVNKEEIVQVLLKNAGHALNGLLIQGMEGFDQSSQPYPYDPAKAKELLTAAGFSSGFKFTLLTLSGRYVRDKETAEAVSGYLSKVGIEARIQVTEYNEFMKEVSSRKSDAFLVGNSSLDTYGILSAQVYSKAPGFAYQNYVNKEVDGLIEKGLATMDSGDRGQVYRQAAGIVRDDAPFIFLHDLQEVYGVKDRVKGFLPRVEGFVWLGNVSVSN